MFRSQIRQRRSIRKYTDKIIEPEKMDQIIEAILRSPSSKRHNPWQFIVVTEPELLERLSKSKPHGSSFLANAPLAIVVCGDPSVTDTWIEDTTIASIFGQLTAESLGLGSCWIQIRDRRHNSQLLSEAYIADLLNIPADLKAESIIVIGYPDEQKPLKPLSDLQFDKVKLNSYQSAYKRE